MRGVDGHGGLVAPCCIRAWRPEDRLFLKKNPEQHPSLHNPSTAFILLHHFGGFTLLLDKMAEMMMASSDPNYQILFEEQLASCSVLPAYLPAEQRERNAVNTVIL